MKNWPDGNKEVSLEKLVVPLKKIIDDHVTWKHDRRRKIEYDGYTTPCTAAISPSPNWHFSKEGLEYHRERGRDLFDVLLLIAFNLGQEQGLRQANQTVDEKVNRRLVELLLKEENKDG